MRGCGAGHERPRTRPAVRARACPLGRAPQSKPESPVQAEAAGKAWLRRLPVHFA